MPDDTGPQARPRLGGLQWLAFLALLVFSLGVVGVTDELNLLDVPPDPRSPDPRSPGSAEVPAPPGSRRAFVFVIDSLRYETAVDPAVMPNLVALQSVASFGKMQNSRDAITNPSLRAAFTGSDRFRVFGFVDNFVAGEEALESLFVALKPAGLQALVYSDGAFAQFGDAIAERRAIAAGNAPEEGEIPKQLAVGEEALAAFESAAADLVIVHVTFTDHVAHRASVGSDDYVAGFAMADEFVGQLAERVGPDETLVVMGDHGHTAAGVHTMGLDVPTFGLYRGPAYAPAVDFAPASILDHRYLLGFGLGLPLASSYEGFAHPEALAIERIPESFRRAKDRAKSQAASTLLGFVGVALGFGACGGLWIAFALGTPRSAVILAALGAGVGGFFLAWGYFLAQLRAHIHEPAVVSMKQFWIGLAVAGVVAGWRWGPRFGGWVVLGLGCIFLYPSVYRYGAMGAMVPAWLCWLALVSGGLVRRQAGEGDAKAIARTGATVLGVFLLIQSFAVPESFFFAFEKWNAFVHPLKPRTDLQWIALAFVAKLIVFDPAWMGRSFRLQVDAKTRTAVAAVLALVFVALQQWPDFATARPMLVPVALLVGGALALGRRPSEDLLWARGTLWLVAVYGAFLHFVRVPPAFYWTFDCLAAGLVISARLLARDPEERVHAAHRSFLLALSVLVAAWCSLAFGIHHVEWLAAYDWFPAVIVEKKVVWFLPWIIGKYTLPLIALRILLQRELPPTSRLPERFALVAVGAVVLAFSGVGLGMAYTMPGSSLYLEAVQHVAALLCVSAGLLMPVGLVRGATAEAPDRATVAIPTAEVSG